MLNPIEQTKKWIHDFVISLDICPFAKDSFFSHNIEYILLESNKRDQYTEQILDYCELFYKSAKTDNSFIIFERDEQFKNFVDFFNFVNNMEEILEHISLSKLIKLVAFHPQFCFEGMQISARANLVNRSPYPMIHLIKKEALDKVAQNDPEIGKKISLRNEQKLESMTEEQLRAILGE